MKIVNDILYIEFKDFMAAGWKENTVFSANLRNGANWQMIKNPSDKRKPLVQYESLIDAHKEKIHHWLKKSHACKHPDEQKCECGNPYEYMAKEPIRKMVVKDFKAEVFFMSYRYDGPKGKDDTLSPEKIKIYSNEAAWLNMLVAAKSDVKNIIKNKLGLRLNIFFTHVSDLLKVERDNENIGEKFPTTYQNILTKIEAYKTDGYKSLLPAALGNKAAAKIKDEVSEAVLLEMIAHPNQYDDVFIAMMYNKWAVENNYQPVNPATVGVWRRKREADITIGRYGNSAFNEKYIRQVKGLAPTKVGMLWESDDYNLNYYFANPNAESNNKDMLRYVSYIVADSKFGLVLGKCYRQAKAPLWEMVKLAYIDAMYYVRGLVNDGNWYSPFELKADHWNKSVAFPFFKSIANFVAPAHANKHRGYIEQLFGSPHAKRAEKLAAHKQLNYNGNNLTAANTGVNIEVLNANRNNRPDVGGEAEAQIEKFFYAMRNLPNSTRENMNALSREQLWLNDFNKLSNDQKRIITDEQFLLTFGFKHEPENGQRNTITNRGVEAQIKGVKYSYDLPNYADGIYLIGTEVDIYFDPYDMSRVLVTDNKKIRFIASSAILHPRALQDTHTNSRTLLNMVLSEKKLQVERATQKQNNRVLALADNDYDEEAVMLAGFMPKELRNTIEVSAEKQLANNRTASDDWQVKQENFDDSRIEDFNFFEQQ